MARGIVRYAILNKLHTAPLIPGAYLLNAIEPPRWQLPRWARNTGVHFITIKHVPVSYDPASKVFAYRRDAAWLV